MRKASAGRAAGGRGLVPGSRRPGWPSRPCSPDCWRGRRCGAVARARCARWRARPRPSARATSTRRSAEGGDEVGQVARAFNHMTRRLRDYDQSQSARLVRARRTAQAVVDSFPDPILVVEPGGGVETGQPGRAAGAGRDGRPRRISPTARRRPPPAWQPPRAVAPAAGRGSCGGRSRSGRRPSTKRIDYPRRRRGARLPAANPAHPRPLRRNARGGGGAQRRDALPPDGPDQERPGGDHEP